MAEEKKQTTSAIDYRQRFGMKKMFVNVPSGAVFEIRKLGVIDFVLSVFLPVGILTEEDLKVWENLSAEDRAGIIQKNSTPEKNETFIKHLLLASVISPKLSGSDVPKEDEISLSELDPFDKAQLLTEIMSFNSLDAASRESLRPFRTE